jgi:hypothetical protein
MEEPLGHIIPVWNGLLEPPHPKKIGPALWVFLWCLDRQTDDDGNVLHGRAVMYKEISEGMGCRVQTVGDHMRRLAKHEYLALQKTKKGTIIRVRKPKKWRRPKGNTSAAGVKKTKDEDNFSARWERACEIGREMGDPDFGNLEFKWFGADSHQKIEFCKKFVTLPESAIRHAFSEWSKMVDDMEKKGKLEMVPTKLESKINRLLVFARRAMKNGSSEASTPPKADYVREFQELQRREAEVLGRQEKGEDVTDEMKAIRKAFAELKKKR